MNAAAHAAWQSVQKRLRPLFELKYPGFARCEDGLLGHVFKSIPEFVTCACGHHIQLHACVRCGLPEVDDRVALRVHNYRSKS